MKEGWNFTPDKRDRWNEPKEKLISPERREFLGALAGFGAAAALSGGTLKYLDFMAEAATAEGEKSFNRERVLDSATRTISANIRSERINRALHGKGHEDLVQIVRALEFPILPEHLTGTSYDVSAIGARYETQLALFRNRKNELTIADRAAILAGNNTNGEDFLSPVDAAYANGVYVDKHTILTNAHVVGMMLGKPGYADEKVIDIGLLQVNRRFAARPQTGIVSYMNAMTDKRIHGSFVAISGIDPDETSVRHGHKLYPGVAVKITDEFAKLILQADENGPLKDERLFRKLRNSFMLILPPGESKYNASADMRPAHGMSGSPVYVRAGSDFVFGGMFWGAWQIKADNKSVDVGFFHGVDEIREATREIKVEFIPER